MGDVTDVQLARVDAESETAWDHRTPRPGIAARAEGQVMAALDAGDVEGHLAVLVLYSGYDGSASVGAMGNPWRAAVERLLSRPEADTGLRTAQAVATAGLRLALGGPPRAEFVAAAHRELAREQMPPAVCVRDDERLLLGVAAGVGVVAPELYSAVAAITGPRRHSTALRQACLDVWAEGLASRATRLGGELARRALAVVAEPSPSRPAILDEDRVAAFWLATRLLTAEWEPRDEDLHTLERVLDAGRRAVTALLQSRGATGALDAALLIDALSASPASRISRQSALEGILSVIEHFPASAMVVGSRYAKRPPFEIRDEYDVQDLFRALAIPVIPDIQPEDPASKVAGKGSRLDFTSRATRLGFELKHVRSRNHAADVREEVLIDESTYQAHPYVDTVVVFIHDPNRFIALGDRAAFEADLSKTVSVSGRGIRYLVRIRG